MMESTKCVNISYKGVKICIKYSVNCGRYMHIIEQASIQFSIPMEQRGGLILTNGRGYIFEKELFENFLLLFPCPKMVFNLNIDWNRLRRQVTTLLKSPKRLREVYKNEDVPTNKAFDIANYAAVPVYRQNCFIGKIPQVLCERSQVQPAVIANNPTDEIPRAKRLRLTLRQQKPRDPHLVTTLFANCSRSLRI